MRRIAIILTGSGDVCCIIRARTRRYLFNCILYKTKPGATIVFTWFPQLCTRRSRVGTRVTDRWTEGTLKFLTQPPETSRGRFCRTINEWFPVCDIIHIYLHSNTYRRCIPNIFCSKWEINFELSTGRVQYRSNGRGTTLNIYNQNSSIYAKCIHIKLVVSNHYCKLIFCYDSAFKKRMRTFAMYDVLLYTYDLRQN